MKRVKGFNFDTVDDKGIIEHIEKQGNQSNYIKELVKKDMKGSDMQELVRKAVDEYLEEVARSIKDYK